jgi:hypothetical protein
MLERNREGRLAERHTLLVLYAPVAPEDGQELWRAPLE